MPFPAGVQTVTLTGHQTLADGAGRPLPVRIRPVPSRVVGAEWGVVVGDDPVVVKPDAAGEWTVTLVAVDAAGFTPTGWTYRVETGGDALFLSLPVALGTVDISELTPAGADDGEYVLVPGPAGADGAAGPSAYEVAVADGFTGTETEWLASLVGPQGPAGPAGDSLVTSVNDQQGAVNLTAADVGADAAGAASAAQAAAVSAAATDATAKVAAHVTATDPHGDRAYADTSKLAKAANLADLADPATARGSLGLGGAATLDVGSAAGTVAAGDDARLSDARPPTAHAASHATGGTDPISASSIGAYLAADGNTLNGYVTDLQNRVGGEFGLENRTTALENTRLQASQNLADLADVATARANLLDGYANVWGPPDHGLTAWTFDPAACTTTGTTLSVGYIYLIELILRQVVTVSKLHAVLGAAGAGLTAGQCLAGLYDTGGNQVGITADQSTAWKSAGSKAMSLTTPYAAAAGRYYVAFLVNGTTSPTFACGSTLGAAFTPGNANLAAGSYRFCRSASGQTALPASLSLAGCTPDANNLWAAAS